MTAAREHHLRSIPETVSWGRFDPAAAPVLHVQDGDVITIDTVSHQGLLTDASPVDFFGDLGIAPEDVLEDASAIHAAVQRPDGAGSHVVTGPIHVAGARPGDALEVRILEATPRVPYGVNRGWPGGGVLPDLLDASTHHLLRLDPAGERLVLAPGISVPFRPFPGIVAVAPPPEVGAVSTRPPGSWGGNLDLRELVPGSAIRLPVAVEGAGLYLGDPHGAQGDGEVNGTAVEQSVSFVVEVRVHHGQTPAMPRVETQDAHLVTGIHEDVAVALRIAVEQAVERIVDLSDGVLDAAGAYALCSVGVDFAFAEAVNHTTTVRGRIPRHLFATSP